MKTLKHWSAKAGWFSAVAMGLAWPGATGTAQSFTILKSFGNTTNVTGFQPHSQLVQGPDGTLYGTTYEGEGSVRGTVFKMQPDGSGFTVLKWFTNSVEGTGPLAGVTLSGNVLYGTTWSGGISNVGTVFKVITDGTGYAVLRHFTPLPGDAASPAASLTLSGSVLYGTTQSGGSSNYGTVFKLNTDGTGYAVLKDFAGVPTDGAWPKAALVLSGDELYGTTGSGGSHDLGTVFRMNTDGKGYTVLKHFTRSDGAYPYASLTLSSNMLYGTTLEGGSSGFGTVFKMNTDGTGYAVLKHFTFNDGSGPLAGLTWSGSVLYGVTSFGGDWNGGTVFKLNTDGTGYTVLRHFAWSDGAMPQAGLTLSGGVLYGTTVQGGALAEGTVFKLELPRGGEVRMTSIIPTTNGVKVAWTNPLPGHAFTLQERDSLSLGNWSNAPTRYRWPSVKSTWVEPGVPPGRARFYRVMAEPAPVPQRGRVLGATLLQTLSTPTIQTTLQNHGLPAAQARWPVRFYKLLYETVDPFGLAITASGALYIPQGPTNPVPLLSDQHGTTSVKNYVPSRGSFYGENALGLLFATSGYVSLLPDCQGLGDSPGFQAYLHARSEATAVVDMLRAVRHFCASNSVNLNSQLFLVGYSQGGHVTMAAHREIETYYSDEFTVTASAPMAGPYDLSGVTLNWALTNRAFPNVAVPLVVAAWLPIYDLGDTFEGLLRAPYDRTLAPLLDGLHTEGEIAAAMPTDSFAVLRPDYLLSLLNDPNHPFRQACRDNDVYQWTPAAPMRLYHCSGDTIVPQANSIVAYRSFTNSGACCVSVIDPGSPQRLDHGPCWLPSILSAKQWFDSLKEGP